VLTKKTNGYLPQLCNRLDKETRGLILVAKNQLTHTFINQKIATKEIQKFYLAKITGYFDVPEGLLEDYLTIKENCVKISETKVNTEYVKIQTAYRTLNINHKTNSSIVEIELLTGKKHQIRAQMNFYHHPLINEKKYSRSPNKPTGNLGLISYKLVFNFDNQDKDFGYLSKKVISLDKNKMIKLLESL
jgi:23S rRNA pseudouridine955/2504/2580 synthase